MTAKRFIVDDCGTLIDMQTRDTFDYVSDVCGLLNELHEDLNHELTVSKALRDVVTELLKENKQLKQFIDDLTTKGTGRIDLANGYSYSVSAVLTNWKGDVE